MNPLSPLTYYRRHKRAALLLLALIGSLTLGLFVLVGVFSTAASSTVYPYHYLTRLSRILAGQALDPGSVARFRASPRTAESTPVPCWEWPRPTCRRRWRPAIYG